MISFSRMCRQVLASVAVCMVLVVPVSAAVNLDSDNKTNKHKNGDIMAQVNVAANTAGLAAEDPRLYIASGIKVILSLIGTLFFILIVFSGYVRLTAHGEEDRVKKSNSTAIAALIGLAIVLLSYAVTSFVTSRIYNASTYEPVYDENNETPNAVYEKTINIELF